MKPRTFLIRLSALLAGAGLVALALFATRLGIDHNVEWGSSRRWVFIIGWLILVAGMWPYLRPVWKAAAQSLRPSILRLESWLAASPSGGKVLRAVRALATWIRSAPSPDVDSPKRLRLAALLTALAVLVTEVAYVFIVSVGTWTDWSKETEYYSLLSQAFRAGQLHLPVEPDPALMALENPYDFAARGDIPILWDSSYYDGRYYLYYGPTPALLLAAAGSLTGKHFGDQYLVFAFVSLINLSLAWMLFYLWRTLFPATSPWLLAVLVAAAGLTNPLPWLLGRPAFYEAAISGGVAFLLLGLALALPEWVEGRTSPARLVAAGAAWALAAGSRVALAPAVLVPVLWLVIRFLRRRPTRWASLVGLLLPLVAGGIAHAWYNLARFGNVLETGFRYVLTTYDQIAGADRMAMANYIPSNLFNYLWMPARWLSVFPFVKAQWGIESVPVIGLNPGGLYQTEQVSGVLRTTPLVLLTLVPFAFAVWRARRQWIGDPVPYVRLALLFGAVALGGLASLAVFHWAAMRFEAQFVPALILLAAVGGWATVEALQRFPAWQKVASLAVAALALRGLVVGLLLGITSHRGRFELTNPELFDALTRFFAW